MPINESLLCQLQAVKLHNLLVLMARSQCKRIIGCDILRGLILIRPFKMWIRAWIQYACIKHSYCTNKGRSNNIINPIDWQVLMLIKHNWHTLTHGLSSLSACCTGQPFNPNVTSPQRADVCTVHAVIRRVHIALHVVNALLSESRKVTKNQGQIFNINLHKNTSHS